jgi:signal peptidase II
MAMKRESSSPRKRVTARSLYATAIAVIVLDLLTKVWIREALPLGKSIDLLPFLSITHAQNVGVAFGLFQFDFLRWVLVALAIGVAAAITWSCKHGKLREHFVAWGLIAGGAIGNALDRIWLGVVTDFIDFHFWPAFNVADSALSIGVIILIWHAWREE